MNDGFHFADIIFFAVLAGILVYRLRAVLGKRTGHERPPPAQWGQPREREAREPDAVPGPDNVIDLSRARKPASAPQPDSPAGAGLAAVMKADRSFTIEEFVSGARMAFEMIVSAFAEGNRQTLRPLLADDVYRQFSDAIMTRERAAEILETELVAIRSADIVDARMDGSNALVTVRFVTDQVNLVKDIDGKVLEGDPNHVTEVIDEWTFRRDTRSRDPNWQLVATRSPEE